jgi:hypothetical protein
MVAPSTIGEVLTRGTIWITLVTYLVGLLALGFGLKRWHKESTPRALWTIGCFSLVLHFAAAFNFYHDWNQDAAYRETARQTDEYIGLNWGGGLYINYAILLLWIGDLTEWWLRGVDSYRKHFRTLRLVWHAFLIFIIFNALIVFKGGVVRWIGVGYCAIAIIAWFRLRLLSASSASLR